MSAQLRAIDRSTGEERPDPIEVPKPGLFALSEIIQMFNSVGLEYGGIVNWRETT